jgi:hypothetical protein
MSPGPALSGKENAVSRQAATRLLALGSPLTNVLFLCHKFKENVKVWKKGSSRGTRPRQGRQHTTRHAFAGLHGSLYTAPAGGAVVSQFQLEVASDNTQRFNFVGPKPISTRIFVAQMRLNETHPGSLRFF